MERAPRFGFTALAFILITVVAVCAQTPSPQDKAAALKEALAANQAALRQYTWVESTTITMKGEVKKQEQKQCYYGADGKVQKTPIAGQPKPPSQSQQASRGGGKRGGRVKEAIVENKVDELKDYMGRAAALVQSYVPPDPEQIQAAKSAGRVKVEPPAGNVARLTITDYLKPGDALAIGLDTAASQLTTYSVDSYVDKPKDDPVSLRVTFGRLEDGTSYPQQVLLDVPAKNMQVKVVNSGYVKKAAS
jgi:hypothetical protein